MFVEKDHRRDERNRPASSSRWILIGILFFSVLGKASVLFTSLSYSAVAVFGGIGYIVWSQMKGQNEEEPNRLDQDYLRKLVKQVNENQNSTWKVQL